MIGLTATFLSMRRNPMFSEEYRRGDIFTLLIYSLKGGRNMRNRRPPLFSYPMLYHKYTYCALESKASDVSLLRSGPSGSHCDEAVLANLFLSDLSRIPPPHPIPSALLQGNPPEGPRDKLNHFDKVKWTGFWLLPSECWVLEMPETLKYLNQFIETWNENTNFVAGI